MKHLIQAGLILGMLSASFCVLQAQNASQSSQPEQQAPLINSEMLKQLETAKYPDLVFAPGDILSVEVYGVQHFAEHQRVEEDGTILFPLIGKMQVAGLTVQQLELNLQDALAKQKMLQEPQVTVEVEAQPSAIVTVSGSVVKPGVFPATAHLSILDYISQAGGFIDILPTSSTVNAPASYLVTLERPSLDAPIRIPLGPRSENAAYGRIPILPGDKIVVGKTGYIYAFGAFRLQGVFPMKNTGPTTLLQLAAEAGGIGFEADRKDAHIIRTKGDSRYIVDVDVNKILRGKAADVALEPDDILFVPTNSMKAAIKGGGSGLLVSLASAYLYTHP